jgi:exonuclease SbcD
VRLLHTGDWHVGRTLRGRSRADEHRAVLAEVVGIVREREVDLVLVAGDLFDTAAPTPEAEKIVYGALLDMARAAAHVVLIAGNHDNPRRLEAIEPLLELTNIHALPALARPQEGGVLRLEVRGEPVAVALLPFLSQRAIVRADDLMAGDAADHAASYADRTARIVERLCAELPAGAVHVLLGHAMVHGGVMGGGERSAHTIFEYSVPATAFPPTLHYVALGHLHRAQKLPAACPAWYAGSPLQLDFGEIEDVKSVNVIEVEADRPAKVTAVPLTKGRQLRTVRGTVDELSGLAETFGGAFLRVEVDEQPAPGLADRVRELLPDAVEVRILRRDAELAAGDGRGSRLSRSPGELFAEYLKERGEESPQLTALFAELLEEAHAPDPA